MTKKKRTPEEEARIAVLQGKKPEVAETEEIQEAEEETKEEIERVDYGNQSNVPENHQTSGNPYLDTFASHFVYIDYQNPGESHRYDVFGYNPNKGEKERVVINVSASTLSSMFIDNGSGGVDFQKTNAITKDLITKRLLRSMPAYKSNNLQEWRMKGHRLERIKVENGIVKVLKDERAKQKVSASDLNSTELEELLAAKRKEEAQMR